MIRMLLVGLVLTAALVVTMPARALADEGEDLWSEFCVSCHGPEGWGDGPAADTLDKAPADFHDCERMGAISDETLRAVIMKGGEANDLSKDMAGYSDRLEPADVDMLLKVVRGFCESE